MSIRFRLLTICIIVTILPAIPITFLVRNLLEKSFNVGLSATVSDALEGGMSVSRKLLVRLESDFEENVQDITTLIGSRDPESVRVSAAIKKSVELHQVDGYFAVLQSTSRRIERPAGSLPKALDAFAQLPDFHSLLDSRPVNSRPPHLPGGGDLSFFETEDKAVQLALWNPSGVADGGLLFYRKIDSDFLASAQKLLDGRQIFAQLRLSQGALSQSFFYPFIIVYGVILLVALVLALLMAERMASPVRHLAEAAVTVAGGDWRVQLRRETGGEIGRLTDSFNLMVSRLDSQRRHLLDMEKVMGWREMARHLAHEIKNPLLPIRLAVQEIRDQYRGEDRKYREFLDESSRVVEDELGHLQRLVKEFSMFAKMPGLSPTTGSLERLVSDLVKLYPQVEARVLADPNLPEFPFDSDQMRRMFVNLFDNSRSASPNGTQTKITIEIKRRFDEAVIVFSDNGPGIPPENIPRIFDPYFTTRGTGTGLGLALVKSIVLMHQGTIGVESSAGGGAKFTVTLPLRGPGVAGGDTNINEEER
jgi:nitrogen fixation/metabolism regulation signal transduction histidine kinase